MYLCVCTCIYICIGNHTFAAIAGTEDYTLLKHGLAPVLEEVNFLIDNPLLHFDEQSIELDFVLGGDYKVSTPYYFKMLTCAT